MRTVVTIAAIISLVGAISEREKGWYVTLFVASVILWMVLGIAPVE